VLPLRIIAVWELNSIATSSLFQIRQKWALVYCIPHDAFGISAWRFPVKRFGFLLKVKRDRIEEYKEHHQEVWPEMLDALRRTGWHNYSLFMREDGLLFGYFETPDSFQSALEGMSREEVNARWQKLMAPCFEDLGGAPADESMVELEEVFHLD
jgi:L-rhamnose mutarotase